MPAPSRDVAEVPYSGSVVDLRGAAALKPTRAGDLVRAVMGSVWR